MTDLDYQPFDVLDTSSVARLLNRRSRSAPTTFYLALPTHLLAPTIEALGTQPLPPSVRVAVEKPFGEDLDGAIALNATLARAVASPEGIFRIDHVLGMDAVARLPITVGQVRADGSEIREVAILWEETLALEGRAAFYDRAGALKDLLQNHLLQILCLVTIAPTTGSQARDLSGRRIDALRHVEVPTREQARTSSRRARYGAGRLATTGGAGGEWVPDYASEPGVDPGRNTETFAEVELRVTSPEWADTRFVLRAGKAMGRRRRGVLLRFRPAADGTERSDLWIDVDRPDVDRSGVDRSSSAREEPAAVEAGGDSALLEQNAYSAVLRSLLSGSHALSVSAEETEMAWRIFTPVLQAWAAGEVPLEQYPAGAQ